MVQDVMVVFFVMENQKAVSRLAKAGPRNDVLSNEVCEQCSP
jgi:hypothetical protein